MEDILKYEIRRSRNDEEVGLSLRTKRKLENIFSEWFKIIDEYCIYDESDAPYWYNERASVSIFTGAIFRSGELAMEEFVCTKGEEGTKNKNQGRADLWFSCGQTNFICEVKQKWYDVGNNLENIMKDAEDATRKTKGEFEYSDSLALTFWTPRFMNISTEDGILKALEGLKKSFESNEIDMYCLAAPKSSRHIKNVNGVSWPCAVLLGKIVN